MMELLNRFMALRNGLYAGILGLSAVPFAWGLAMRLVGPGRMTRARRAVPCVLVGAITALLSWPVLFLYARYQGTRLFTLVGASWPVNPSIIEIASAWGRFSFVFGAALVLGSAVGALILRDRPERARGLGPGRLDGWTAFAATVGGYAALGLLVWRPQVLVAALPLPAFALAPLVGMALALRLRLPPRFPDETAGEDEAEPGPAPQPGPDPVRLLRNLGLVGDAPAFAWPSRSASSSGSGDLARCWAAVGGKGPPPAGLPAALEAAEERRAQLVADLPDDAARMFFATLALALVPRGARVLVLTARAEPLAATIRAGIAQLGSWSAGPVVVGPGALSRSFIDRRLPSVVLLTDEELAGEGLARLGHAGSAFLRQCGVLLIDQPDRFSALRASQLGFALSRLRLIRTADRRPRAALVAARGTPRIRTAVGRMLGQRVSRLDAGLGATEQVRLFAGRSEGIGSLGISKAVQKAARALDRAGLDWSVEDDCGLLQADELRDSGRPTELDPPGRLRARVVLSVLQPRSLPSLYRVAPQRPARSGGERHGQVVVYWVMSGPLAHFLLDDGRLAQQAEQGLLPSPTPLLGRHNDHLRRLHVEAALFEGRPSELELREAFGNRAVSEVRSQGAAVIAGGRAWQRDGTLMRSLGMEPQPDATRPDGRRRTVTSRAVEVVDGANGAVLDQVDQLTARTHYYPHRVFGRGGRRYQVAGEGIDRSVRQLSVRAVSPEYEPTLPRIGFRLQHRSWLTQLESSSRDRMQLTSATADVLIQERVNGALRPDGSTIEYPSVESRYFGVVRVVFLTHLQGQAGDLRAGLTHAARVVDEVAQAHLGVSDEYLEVEPLVADFGGQPAPGLVFIDRHIGGMGLAEVLDLELTFQLLRWARSLMKVCPCMDGCPRCTPPQALGLKAKQAAIAALGG